MESLRLGCDLLLGASLSGNTKTVYSNALKRFSDFRSQYTLANVWPVPVSVMAFFVSFCYQQGYSPSSVMTYMSAISFVHKLRNIDDPVDSFIIRKLLEGFKRLQSKKDLRAPITEDILIKIIQSLPFICYNQYELALFQSVYSLAYFGLFRVGEMVFTDHRQSGYPLTFDDITLASQSLTVRIRISKTNQCGRPVFLNIPSNSSKLICPVFAMQKYLSLRGSFSGNLFCHANRLSLTRYQFGAILSKALSQIGLSSKFYKSHSFRIGRATSLAISGVPSDQIKKLGRWKSNVFSSYIRP